MGKKLYVAEGAPMLKDHLCIREQNDKGRNRISLSIAAPEARYISMERDHLYVTIDDNDAYLSIYQVKQAMRPLVKAWRKKYRSD